MEGSAVFSKCDRYRYVLRRVWNSRKPTVMFVGLNPSTADAQKDDATIRRCVRFARDWGYGALVMTNLFAYRATRPHVLPRVADPVGPRNNWWLSTLRNRADLIVIAWGTRGALLERDRAVLGKLGAVHCLGLTKGGHPKHPLYLRASATPAPFSI